MLRKLLYLFSVTAVLFAACRKETVIQNPGGTPSGTSSNVFRFTLDSLPDGTGTVGELYAIVTITNAQNDTVLTNKKLVLRHNDKYVSDSIALPAGTYRVINFLIVTENNITRFVTPVAASIKASLVQKPLPVFFTLPNRTATNVQMEVARVSTGDAPELFGYPNGSFNNPPVGEPEDPNATLQIVVHPVIKIGDVIYDSVPVSFALTTWNKTGNETTIVGSWEPGKNKVTLLKSAIKNRLQVSKWGIRDEITLQKADIQEGTTYTLGGSRTAKKLSSVLIYKLEDDAYKPETRELYEYGESGRLNRILYQKKRPDNSPYTAMTETFHYNGNGKIDNVDQYNETNSLLSTTTFSYDQQDKIRHMEQRESGNETKADVTYMAGSGNTGISGKYGITILYHYSQHYYTMAYNMEFVGGNNVQDGAITSHHSSDLGVYQYDFNINPYVHLNRPDLYLSQFSKNNVTVVQKTYSNMGPAVVPYDCVYTYDADGYPKEVVKSYKTYETNKFLYKEKTVFNY